VEEILDSRAVAQLIVDAALDKKAADIHLLDVRELTTLSDYFVVCEGNSARQLRAIADGILENLKEENIRIYQREGTPESGWVLLDYGNVLTHIFSPDRRQYYQLENLWQDAATVVRML
jgi:ribosome-associated protein